MLTNRSTFASALALIALANVGCASSAPPEAATAIALDAPAERLEGERYLEVRVGVHIDAPPATVWGLLTDAPAYPAWNSTVTQLDGTIAEGERIELHSTVDPDRTFELEVSDMVADAGMVWSDGNRAFRGVRTFALREREDGSTDFTMREVFTGTMMRMIAPKLPDLRPSFDSFAADLERAAEAEPR